MIIITGGAGLIGSSVISGLNLIGRDDLIVVDHLGSGEKWKNLAPLKFRDYIEKNEFMNSLLTDRLSAISGFAADKIDAIIHLGACSSTREQDASFLVGNNFEYSKKLALFALKNNIRFVYASSAATYGDGRNGFSDDDSLLDTLRPLNMYGYSKHLFDQWAFRSGFLDKMAGLKYFNVFGPNEYHKGDMRSQTLKAYEQITTTGCIKLFKSCCNEYADGEQMRDFLYVKDAADMTIHFMRNRSANGIFNIGSGTAHTWNSLAFSIFRALDRPEHIEYIDMPGDIREKYQYFTRADISKLRRSGYDRATIPIGEAIDDYVKNYLINRKRLGE